MRLKNGLLLLLTATIWGIAFVAQSVGNEYVGPFTFNAVRSLIGAIVLLPVICLFKDANKANNTRQWIKGGICCGVLLFLASNFQQYGILYTTAGKAGFITALYIIIVPIISIFLHKKCPFHVWLAVILAMIGLYFLCIQGSLQIQIGDIYLFICAILFAFHILAIDHFVKDVDGVMLSCLQFFVCGILSSIFALLFEDVVISNILDAWMPILYAGVLSSGVAYTLQIIGQKDMDPTISSLILSLESCISVLAGFILLHESLSTRELIGCLFMFLAIILAQLPTKSRN